MVHTLQKKRLYIFIFTFLGTLLIVSAQTYEKAKIETVQVADGVYMLSGINVVAGNIGVSAGKDGVLLIDSQYPQMVEKIKAAIAAFSDGPIRFVLNTNWHWDHADGNELLAKDGALIVAHENSRKQMAREKIYDIFDYTAPPSPEAAWPVITCKDSVTLHFNGEAIQAIHAPNAHSDADLFFYFSQANVLHTGDLYFVGMFPFIDIDFGGTIDGMIAAADRMLAMVDEQTRIIPGHGPLSNRDEMQAYRNMLVTMRDRIAKLIKAGKTLDEVLEAETTAEFEEGRESNVVTPELFVEVVYTDLSRRKKQ